MTTLLTTVLVLGLLILAIIVWLQRRASGVAHVPERSPHDVRASSYPGSAVVRAAGAPLA